MKHISMVFAFALAGCGAAAVTTPTTTTSASAPVAQEAPLAQAAQTVETPAVETTQVTPAAPTPPPAEATAEKCDGGWVCVKVSFETRKVEKRDTKLLGDPKIEETWSKNSDGRTASFEGFSKGTVELTLRRKPNNKSEVVVKLKGGEIVIDRHDGSTDDFTHVGAIATEKDGALLVDLRYLR
jgi:hypothetical protein